MGAGDRKFLIYLIYSNKLACLQLKSFGLYKQSSQVMSKVRNSCSKVFCKKGVLTNFTKFTRKQLWQSLFFNKVAGLILQLYEKRGSGTGLFLWIFPKFLRTSFIIEHLWWLLLQGYLTFSENLEKYVWMTSSLEPATLLKII